MLRINWGPRGGGSTRVKAESPIQICSHLSEKWWPRVRAVGCWEVDNFTYVLGDNQSVDGRGMGNVRTEKSMTPRCQQRLLGEWISHQLIWGRLLGKLKKISSYILLTLNVWIKRQDSPAIYFKWSHINIKNPKVLFLPQGTWVGPHENPMNTHTPASTLSPRDRHTDTHCSCPNFGGRFIETAASLSALTSL